MTSELYDYSDMIKAPVDNHSNTQLTDFEVFTSRLMRKKKQEAGKREVRDLIKLRDSTGYWDAGLTTLSRGGLS